MRILREKREAKKEVLTAVLSEVLQEKRRKYMVRINQEQLIYEDVRCGEIIVNVEWQDVNGRPSRRHVLDALREFYREYEDDIE